MTDETTPRSDGPAAPSRRPPGPTPAGGCAERSVPAVGPRSTTAALLLAGTVAGLAGPALLGAVVDVVSRHGHRGTIDRLALALVAAVLAEAGFAALARLAMARLGEDLLAELRRETLGRALDLDVETVELAGTGDLVGRCTTDIAVLGDMTRDVLPWVASAATLTVLTLGALCLQSPVLALTALAGTPVSGAATRRYVRRAPPVYRTEREAMAELVGGLVETSEGARTLRAYGAAPAQSGRVRLAAAGWLRARAAGVHIRARFFPGLAIGQGISLAATVAAGAYLSSRGVTDDRRGHCRCAVRGPPLRPAVAAARGPRQAPVGPRVAVPAGGGPGHPPARGAAPPRRSRRHAGWGACPWAHVRLPGGAPVLTDVDLDLAAGQRAVVVGASGAGKSTLACLLAGLLRPASGAVTAGRHELADLAAADRRRLVALVTQEPHVFAGTVGWNVTLGAAHRPDVDPGACLAAVGATWAPGLPAGLDTVVGPGGHRLTPAQAQQVALARLVAADPSVVILDEATADLSGSAAGAAESALVAALANRTVIAIAHRLDTAATADVVVVMHEGRIVETGSHGELVAREGAYAALWSAWARSR